jgi:dihydrofolate synthase/folylpolyglutamate synthase
MTLTYPQALEYLYSFINYEHHGSYHYSSETFQLDRFSAFLAALGDPERRYPAIHIAGTKGKGSVAALCESALRAAGYRVGLYTSPHLQDFRERIQVDRELIPETDFVALVETIQPVVAEQPGLTWFELVTALAFLHFARRRVDYAVLEVGLGGRLDATNVVTPEVAVITSISLDHTQLLGTTLAEIAGEKAGIIKPGVPVVTAPQAPEVAAVLARVAAERGAPHLPAEQYSTAESRVATPGGQSFCFWLHPPDGSAALSGELLPHGPSEWWLPLAGEHQLVNAQVALLVLDVLAARATRLSLAALHAGLAGVRWPGRFELIQRAPAVVLDAAHNPDSVAKLARTIDALYPGQPLTLIFGASADKDLPAMLAVLAPRARRLILTRAPNVRAADPNQLAEIAAGLGATAEVVPDVDEALARALDGAGDERVIVATGSVFIAGAVRDAWQRRIAAPSGAEREN